MRGSWPARIILIDLCGSYEICVIAFPKMQIYSNFLSRGLTNNEIQTLHEDSLKGVTVNGQM